MSSRTRGVVVAAATVAVGTIAAGPAWLSVPAAAAGAAVIWQAGRAYMREPQLRAELDLARKHKSNAITRYQALNIYTRTLESRLDAFHQHPSTTTEED
jgi:hypothetical protein